MKTTKKTAYEIGFEDGETMARESGCPDAPADGWDGSFINAVGFTAACEILGEEPEDNEEGWSDSMIRKLSDYSAGAQAGADGAAGL